MPNSACELSLATTAGETLAWVPHHRPASVAPPPPAPCLAVDAPPRRPRAAAASLSRACTADERAAPALFPVLALERGALVRRFPDRARSRRASSRGPRRVGGPPDPPPARPRRPPPSLPPSSRTRTGSPLVVSGDRDSIDYGEYGRRGRQEFRANVVASFPKFVLASAACLAIAGATDFFKFSRAMRDGGAERRWRDLAGGDKSGKDGHAGEPTVIYDVKGRVVATLSSEAVKLKDVAPAVYQAVVATEDHRFFEHRGVDLRGLLRAIGSLGTRGGGSTITQQLVKNLVLCQDRTISRKLAEILLSVKIETVLTKDELLEAYLNNVYWGHGAYGVAAAAASYYGKSPAELDVSEAALLAALLPAPEALSPYANPAGARRVRARALAAMAKHGYLEKRQADRFADAPLPASLALRSPSELEAAAGLEGSSALDEAGLVDGYGSATGEGRRGGVPRLGRGAAAPYRAPFFTSEVLYHLKALFRGKDVLKTGGLKVHTTMDLSLQETAERLVLEDGLTVINGQDKGEAALVAVDPASGGVRVLVGGREYASSPFNRATLARRTSGSAFKPFVYLAALEEGVVNPSSLIQDEAQTFELTEGEDKTYTPRNYTKTFRGTVSLRDCLVESLNVPTVKVAETVGVEKIQQMSRRLGITSPLPNALSLALGSCETTPLEMAVAYATIAAGGIYSKPHLISKVRDSQGATVYKHKGVRRMASSASATAALHSMLRAAVTRGTGRSAARGWPAEKVAGKTGTSDEYRDAWFAGYTPSLACVVWCGRDDNGSLPGTGATCAAPLWGKFMRVAGGGAAEKRGAGGENAGNKFARRARRKNALNAPW